MARILGAALLAVTSAALSGGCKSRHDNASGVGSGAAPASSVPGFGDGPVVDRVVSSLIDQLPFCDIEHRGIFVDFGTPMVRGRVTQQGSTLTSDPDHVVEHEGATWSIIGTTRTLEMPFVLSAPTRIFISARVQSKGAKSVAFMVDDQLIGSARLKPDADPKTITTETTELPFDAGEHTLTVRFAPARVKGDVHAHVDWARVGFPDELKTTYGPTTLTDVVQDDAALGRVPHRALRLKQPGLVRCPFRVPPGARFRAALGLIGAPEAVAEVAIRIDGKPAVTLLQRKVKGGAGASWEDVDASLDAYAGQLVQIELRAAGTPTAGRVLFGDPEILVSSAEPRGVQPAQVAVVVVLSGIDKRELPGYADHPTNHLERLTKLAEESAVFQRHRASTNTVSGNMASMMTGLPPEVHTVDYGSALPLAAPTLGAWARDSAVQSAFFTSVPHSFEPTGLSRGVTKMVQVSPVEGEDRDVMAEAAKWLEDSIAAAPNGRILLVVHARGGHPPWHAPQKQLDVLPPENYAGEIQPRRAAQQLAMHRRKGGIADLSDQDMTRIAGLYQLALVETDRGVGRLLDVLDTANLEDHSLFIVTTDQSSALSTLFADAPPYQERSLELPLYVKFPEGALAGRRVERASAVEDLTITIMNALEIQPPREPWGKDLAKLASGYALDSEGPSFALFGDVYTARWESLVLRDRRQGKATLCDLQLDPTCTFDRRPTMPYATEALNRMLAAYEERAQKTHYVRVPLTLDDATLSALRVWGSMD